MKRNKQKRALIKAKRQKATKTASKDDKIKTHVEK